MKFGHTKAFMRKQEIISIKQQIKQLQDKLDRLVEKDRYYVEQDQKRLEEKNRQEALRKELNNPKYEWFDIRDLDNLYQTREELMEAECDQNEIGRINWDNWERVVKETKKWIRQK